MTVPSRLNIPQIGVHTLMREQYIVLPFFYEGTISNH